MNLARMRAKRYTILSEFAPFDVITAPANYISRNNSHATPLPRSSAFDSSSPRPSSSPSPSRYPRNYLSELFIPSNYCLSID